MIPGPRWIPAAIAAAFAAGLALGGVAARASRDAGPERDAVGVDLVGAGATFPYPLYRRWFATWAESTGVRITYFSVGSAGGIYALAHNDADFGATDRPVLESELLGMHCGGPVAIPTALGAVAVAYNLPDLTEPLRLDGAVLADIFAGRIVRWDAAPIAQLNRGVRLPSLPIRVVHRADGSGTGRIFAEYLHVAGGWPALPPAAPVRWPIGTGVTGNEGVAAEVKATIGSIGYVEASYAWQVRLPVAAIRNRAGAWRTPRAAAVVAAGDAAYAAAEPDSVTSLLGAQTEGAYPISSLTWLLIPTQSPDTARAAQVVRFARWALRTGGDEARALAYAPLPGPVAAHYDSVLAGLRLQPCAERSIEPRPDP